MQKTVGEFVPGALATPELELGGIGANLVKYALTPGVASQAAGDMV